MCPCSPQSWQYRVSLLPLPLPLPCAFLLPVPPLSLSLYQSGLLRLAALGSPSCLHSCLRHLSLPLVHSSAPFPRCHIPDPFGPFLSAPLPALYPFRVIAHTSSYDMSLLVSESLCVIFASCVPTFPRSIGTGPSSAIISLTMVSSFSTISSNFLGPVRNSRLVSFGIISLHHECLLCFINRFELMLVLGHFQ